MTTPIAPQPLLSICIPTYNRSHYLAECLGNITSQFGDRNIYERVEIIISDNASSDNTERVVDNYKNKFDNIYYFKNNSNLGYDRNVEKAIYLARGNFVWTLSDDDFIKPGSLNFLFFVFMRYPEVSWICIDNSNTQKNDITEYINGSELLTKIALAGGQLSQNIYNRKYLPADIKKYFGNLWIHYSLAREIAAKRPQLAVKNLFQTPETEHPCDWAAGGMALITYVKLKQIIDGLPALGYDKEAITAILKSLAKNLPRQVASAKIHGLKTNYTNFKLILESFNSYPFSLSMTLIIFFVPSGLLRHLKLLFHK